MFFKLAKEGKKLVLLSFLISIVAFFILGFGQYRFGYFSYLTFSFLENHLELPHLMLMKLYHQQMEKLFQLKK